MSGAAVHINRPSRTAYAVRLRMPGCRKWRLLPGHSRKLSQAVERLARVFAGGSYKRGEVLLMADYYEPVMMIEMVRR